jgi:hypothetical protein
MIVVKHLLIMFMAGVFTLLLIGIPALAFDIGKEKNVVPISDALAASSAGFVDEISVRGTRYEFRSIKGTQVAYGPKTTAAELAPLAGRAKIDVK